jgi:hypothetical protein
VSFYPFDQDEYLDIVEQWLRSFGASSNDKSREGDPSKLGGRYVAIIRNVAHTDLAFESITISVEIDHDGRVVHVDVGRVTTGI